MHFLLKCFSTYTLNNTRDTGHPCLVSFRVFTVINLSSICISALSITQIFTYTSAGFLFTVASCTSKRKGTKHSPFSRVISNNKCPCKLFYNLLHVTKRRIDLKLVNVVTLFTVNARCGSHPPPTTFLLLTRTHIQCCEIWRFRHVPTLCWQTFDVYEKNANNWTLHLNREYKTRAREEEDANGRC